MLFRFIIYMLLLFLSIPSSCQISHGGIPYSFLLENGQTRSLKQFSINNIPTIDMPTLNDSIIENLQKSNSKENDSYQFAYSFDVKIDVKDSATRDSIENGILYKLAIKSSEAYSINLIFSEYHIPPGAKLFLYNEHRNHILGAFTSNNNKGDKIFAISPVSGEKIIIEYFEPYFPDFTGSLIIGKVSHDFLDILNTEEISTHNTAGDCEVDINCSEGNNWQNEKRAVCKIMINGNSLCSGALINNINQNGTPYFLTANHCISTQQAASSSIFYFNYEKSSCNSNSLSLSQSISSATLKATASLSDFTLLELSKKPMTTFQPYFAGWDRNNTQNAGGVGIHHPRGDVKKISTFSISPQTSDCFSSSQSPHFYKIKWSETSNGFGVTEGGSSGSPLFNAEKKIIGQLYGAGYCNNSNCTDPSNDISNYGKFCTSWSTGTSSNERLMDWLDASNKTFILNGLDACPSEMAFNLNLDNTISSGIYQATNNIVSAGTITTGNNVKYEAGNSITLLPNFSVEPGAEFYATIKDFDCAAVPAPINVITWNNAVCLGKKLEFNVINATSYTIKIYSSAGQLVYSGNGNITSNPISVWTAQGVSTGYYIANITFNSSESNEELSNAYKILVQSCSKSTHSINIHKDTLKTIQEYSNKNLDFIISQNDVNHNLTLEILKANDMKPYSVEIFNFHGELISKMEHCNMLKFQLDYEYLPQETYFIKLTMGIHSTIKKIAIQ